MHCLCLWDNFIAKYIATYVDKLKIACICYRRSLAAFFKQIYPFEHLPMYVSYLVFLIKHYLETSRWEVI